VKFWKNNITLVSKQVLVVCHRFHSQTVPGVFVVEIRIDFSTVIWCRSTVRTVQALHFKHNYVSYQSFKFICVILCDTRTSTDIPYEDTLKQPISNELTRSWNIETEDTPRSVVRLIYILSCLSYSWTVKDE
jgi:hypothetical protein